ncbi:sterol desaturase family protein [Oceanicaulis sp.]|uniref:sterol desaturase family protein n=1 Tax=Oceanicaulis sp. TaxID=1924941 RepID=UPI003D2A4A3F
MLERLVEFLGSPMSIWLLAGAYFGMVISERVFYLLRRRGDYNNADALCSIGLNLMNSVLGLLIGFALPFAASVWLYDNARLFTIDAVWLALPVAFLCHELAYYWEHRLGHRVGLFWAFHSIHHSSNEFNHSTAARGFYLDGKLQILGALTASMLGVPPMVYLAIVVVKSAYGIWNHASYVGDLGWMEKVFATPRNHMVHHANQPKYIDKNYSQVLILWDRLFGTFQPYEERPIVGLVSPVHDNNPLTAQFIGFRQLFARMGSAKRWSDRLAYLWKPPEWSHDGVCRSDCPKYAAKMAPAE